MVFHRNHYPRAVHRPPVATRASNTESSIAAKRCALPNPLVVDAGLAKVDARELFLIGTFFRPPAPEPAGRRLEKHQPEPALRAQRQLANIDRDSLGLRLRLFGKHPQPRFVANVPGD